MILVQIAEFKIEKMNKSDKEEGGSGFCLFFVVVGVFFGQPETLFLHCYSFFKLILNKKVKYTQYIHIDWAKCFLSLKTFPTFSLQI